MYIIAYDVTLNKERERLVERLYEFAERVQKSVWISFLTGVKHQKMIQAIEELNLQSGYVDIWQAESEGIRIGKNSEEERKWVFDF